MSKTVRMSGSGGYPAVELPRPEAEQVDPAQQQEKLLKVQKDLRAMADKLWEVDGAKFDFITSGGLKLPVPGVPYKHSESPQGALPPETALAAASRFPDQVEGVREMFYDLRAWFKSLEQQSPAALAEAGSSLDAGYRRRIFMFLCAVPAVRRIFLYQAAELLETLSCIPEWSGDDAVDKHALQAALMQSPARSNSQAAFSPSVGSPSKDGDAEGSDAEGANPFDGDDPEGEDESGGGDSPSKKGWKMPQMPKMPKMPQMPQMPWRGSGKEAGEASEVSPSS